MSLDTVLQIGKVLRSSENSLKYFKYVEPCPQDKDGNWPICITIPVKEDFSFDWEGMKNYIPENQREKLCYLKFSTSNSDTSAKKYGWGDIYYSRQSKFNKEGKVTYNEFGNYTFNKSNAFLNGKEVFSQIKLDYFNRIISPLIAIIDEKEKTIVIKAALTQLRDNKTAKIPKSIQKHQLQIDSFVQNAKIIEENHDLFRFQKRFEEQIKKIEFILKYAPAIDYAIQNESHSMVDIFQDEDTLKKLYRKVVLQNELEKVKKIFKKGENVEELSSETIEKIDQFADFKLFIHFDFDGKNWHELDSAFQLIKDNLNSEITDASTINFDGQEDRKVIVPSKNIYRTLCSGNPKNDWQFPQFDLNNRYKSFTFKDDEQFEDFLHTDRIALKNPLRKIRGTDIGIYIFPVAIGKEASITYKEYESFFFDKKDETKLSEPLFSFERDISQFKRFDFIFTDVGGNTENDRIEISGIEKSRFLKIKKRIEDIALTLTNEKRETLGKHEIKILGIEDSFTNLLGKAEIEENPITKKAKVVFKNMTKTSNGLKPVPQYQSHLLKVLPLIYTENYYSDEVLLPELIHKVEFTTRSGDETGNYLLLIYDLKFLLTIQNNNSNTNRFMEITDSTSYQIGLRLGKLSKPLKKKINSFEKKYVGLLTRHISTKDDCIHFSNEINEMLVRHEKTWGQMSSETIGQIVSLPNKEYDKDKVALGFFEGYFKYETSDDKKSLLTKLEKLISDYDGIEGLGDEIQTLRQTFEEIR